MKVISISSNGFSRPKPEYRKERKKRKKRRVRDRTIPLETRKEALLRDHYRCQECFALQGLELHHCFSRARYKGPDRHEAWNLSTLCHAHHMALHEDNDLQEKYERIAFKRRPKQQFVPDVMRPYLP